MNHPTPESEFMPKGLNPRLTFETFAQGKEDEFACGIAMQVATEPGNPLRNPLFIYGNAGVGKTHLMHAIGMGTLMRNPDARIQYIHADKLIEEVVRAYQHKAFEKLHRHFKTLDLLLVDDIYLLGEKKRSQHELMAILDRLLDNGKQLVVSSNTPPNQLEGFEDTLRDRLEASLHVHLDHPGADMRLTILRTKAAQENMAINDNVALFISDNTGTSVRQLEGAIKRVIAYSRINEKPSSQMLITLRLAKDALG